MYFSLLELLTKHRSAANQFFLMTYYLLEIFFRYFRPANDISYNKAFRHVETLFVLDNQVRTDQNKHFLLTKKQVCFDQYELDFLGRIKFLHVKMPYCIGSTKR